jgi:hypothetical protein
MIATPVQDHDLDHRAEKGMEYGGKMLLYLFYFNQNFHKCFHLIQMSDGNLLTEQGRERDMMAKCFYIVFILIKIFT